MLNDRVKSEGTITHRHTSLSKWPPPIPLTKGSKRHLIPPFKFYATWDLEFLPGRNCTNQICDVWKWYTSAFSYAQYVKGNFHHTDFNVFLVAGSTKPFTSREIIRENTYFHMVSSIFLCLLTLPWVLQYLFKFHNFILMLLCSFFTSFWVLWFISVPSLSKIFFFHLILKFSSHSAVVNYKITETLIVSGPQIHFSCESCKQFTVTIGWHLVSFSLVVPSLLVGECGLVDECWVHKQKVVGSSPVMANMLCPWVRHFTSITPLDPETYTDNTVKVTGLL